MEMDINFEEIIRELNERELEQFKNLYDRFKHQLDKIRDGFAPPILEHLNEFYLDRLNHLAEGLKFRLKLVIDTNIIFSEIRAILMGKPSFLSNLINIPFLELFAPKKIREELFKTIEEDLPPNLDMENAYSLAYFFFEKINILDQENEEAWEKAYILLKQYDKDDIPFLALAISLNAHGIITKDKHFNRQEDMSVWKLGISGKVASTISRGVFSLYILDYSLNKILFTLARCIFIIFQGFLEFCHELYSAIKAAFISMHEKYSNLPTWLQVGIPVIITTIPTLILIFSEKARNSLKDFVINLKDNLSLFIKHFRDDLKYNIEMIKNLTIKLYPFFELVIEGMGYLFYSAILLAKQIKALEDRSVI